MKTWLDRPWMYELSQRAVTRGDCWNIFIERYLQPVPGGRLLDLGCGTGRLLDFLPSLEYWGLDSNPRYIRFAQRRKNAHATFLCAELSERWPVEGRFDRVMATGLLHHLRDPEVTALLKNVRSLLKPGGKFVTFDGCYEKGQPAAARWLLSMDRGEYVRTLEGYEALARPVFKQVGSHIERRLLRLPYSHLIMEMAVD